jgi:hypothetical protein
VTPVSAAEDAEAFFLCEKTDSISGQPILPSAPQYDSLEYNNNIVPLLQPLVKLALILMVLFGIGGAIYATLRDAMFTPDNDDDATQYVRMRIKLIIGGIATPTFIIIGGFIVERITTYETMCLLPNIL